MLRIHRLLAAGLVVGAVACLANDAQAFNKMRKMMGGHPYHNGYYSVPPASAYQAVRLRPPVRYGAPAYYYPGSYLAPGTSYYPAAWYPGVPSGRAAGYYMSGTRGAFFYPHHRPLPHGAR